jgi:hypothetical protein
MRQKVLPSVIALMLSLVGAGCVMPHATHVAAAPPAPQPAPQPPPEEMPISIVQNATALPPDQPVPPEALPPLDPPEQITPRSQPSDAAEAARRRTAARKPPETVTPVPTPAPAAPAVSPATQPAGPLVASDPNLPGRDAMAAKINDVKASAARIAQTGLTGSQRTTYNRIGSFIKLSERALSRGDLRQAGELADRAATLARALTRDN